MSRLLVDVLKGAAGGAAVGVVAGLVAGLFDVWLKDLRDARLSRRGMPLPKDRVFRRYYWAMLPLGAASSAVLVALGYRWSSASLAPLFLPALLLFILLVSWVATLATRG